MPDIRIEKPASVKPIELAALVYSREVCARSFKEDLEAHLLHGYVHSTPDFFAMGRAVVSSATPADIVNPWVNWPREECDAWLVYLMAGNLAKATACVPYPLPKIGWERKNVLRFYPADRAKELLERGGK